MELILVGAHPYKIKEQNSKTYYTTFTSYKYFRRRFLQGFNNHICDFPYCKVNII